MAACRSSRATAATSPSASGWPGSATRSSGKDVAAHPYLGGKLKQDEPTKYLPATRKSIDDWSSVVPEDELKAQRAAGYFLDLWHWRANRSNPVNLADDQLVAEARLSDAGKSAYATNWDGEKKLPRLMFDAAKAGHAALKWDDIVGGKVDAGHAPMRCARISRRRSIRMRPGRKATHCPAGSCGRPTARAPTSRWPARRAGPTASGT